jgi:hypothetical protein
VFTRQLGEVCGVTADRVHLDVRPADIVVLPIGRVEELVKCQ